MTDNPSFDEQALVNRVIQGDTDALAELFSHYHDRLWRTVQFRMDSRLRGRVDPDDILQEAWMDCTKRVNSFLKDASRSIFVWFRLVVSQTLVDVHRRHISAQNRSAANEFSIERGWTAASTSMSLSFHLLGHLTSPSQAMVRKELSQQLEQALAGMNEVDREVLALRHFEELTNRETAQIIGISEQAASVRYMKALKRLKHVMEAVSRIND